MANKLRITADDYIRANRKAAREEEIAAHGHPVNYRRVFKSKKNYDRKRDKANLSKGLPYLFICALDLKGRIQYYG